MDIQPGAKRNVHLLRVLLFAAEDPIGGDILNLAVQYGRYMRATREELEPLWGRIADAVTDR